MSASQILGFVGTGLVVVGYAPQIVHMVGERCTAGISVPAFVLWCLASVLFLIHAMQIRDTVFIGVQIVNVGAGSFIAWYCRKHRGEVCPFHRMSPGIELEWRPHDHAARRDGPEQPHFD
jgi:uncharacterized protein with PQ loop repeat